MFKTLIHGGAEVSGFFSNVLYAVARIAAGCMLAFGHGLGKMPPSEKFIEGVGAMGFPSPELFAWAASLAEFGGGLLIAIGLATRPAALAVGFTMLVAAFVRHAPDPFNVREPALLYLVLSLVFVAIGSGSFSLDRRLRQ